MPLRKGEPGWPGCGEIKAHNQKGIVKGLEQLRTSCHGESRHRILITYLPVAGSSFQPQDSGKAKRVLVMATFVTRDYSLMTAEQQVERVLDQRWYLVEDMLLKPAEVAGIAMDLATRNRAQFGNVMHTLVEKAFDQRVLQLNPPRKRQAEHRPGSGKSIDLLWSELAGLYDELARELGDPFFAELASELATNGETQTA
jgi:hypothetical protein